MFDKYMIDKHMFDKYMIDKCHYGGPYVIPFKLFLLSRAQTPSSDKLHSLCSWLTETIKATF